LELYAPYFRQVIFYSDVGEGDDREDINYCQVRQGADAHLIFFDMYNKGLVPNDIDGIFYLMDDCVLNLNILRTFRCDKIITSQRYRDITVLADVFRLSPFNPIASKYTHATILYLT
jgi:hypothetical protein